MRRVVMAIVLGGLVLAGLTVKPAAAASWSSGTARTVGDPGQSMCLAGP